MNDYLLPILVGTYLIGIPITYAIMEDPKDKNRSDIAAITAAAWPIVLVYYICNTSISILLDN